jgi:hypothetical protein
MSINYNIFDDVKEAVEHSFDFSDELKLWVVPFVIEEGQEQLLLPQGASFTSMMSSINTFNYQSEGNT